MVLLILVLLVVIGLAWMGYSWVIRPKRMMAHYAKMFRSNGYKVR